MHDLVGAQPLGSQQDDPGAPNVLLRRVAVAHDRRQPSTISGRHIHSDSRAHAPDSHAHEP
jgi:hypothetical protein